MPTIGMPSFIWNHRIMVTTLDNFVPTESLQAKSKIRMQNNLTTCENVTYTVFRYSPTYNMKTRLQGTKRIHTLFMISQKGNKIIQTTPSSPLACLLSFRESPAGQPRVLWPLEIKKKCQKPLTTRISISIPSPNSQWGTYELP